MRSRRAHDPGRGRRVVLLAALVQCLGCASWNPLGDLGADPMEAEMRRLEAEQQRIAREEAARDEAAERERAERPRSPEERMRQGDAHLAAGRIGQAVWEYAAAHRLDPASAEPRVRLGYVHLRHEPERAQPLFESALEREPDHVSAHIGLGLSLLSSGRREEGIRHLERAVILAPDSAKARAALGVSLDQLGRHEAALEQLEAARKLRPHDARILNNLGVAHLRSGDPERAEALVRAALREDARDTALRSNNLGMALAMQGRFDEALAAFRRGGDEQGARSNLGYAHYMRGEYERAIAEYEKALVAGGAASVQVVRNLEAARRALATAGREVPAARPLAGPPARAPEAEEDAAPAAPSLVELAPDAPSVVRDATSEAERGDDPWLWKGAPPGALAE